MRFIVTADMLFKQLGDLQSVLRGRLDMNDRELTDAESEALAKMADEYLGIDIDSITKKELYKEFMQIKRIEAKDIWWLSLWRFFFNIDANKRARDSCLKMGVYFLIHEDLRKPIGVYADDDEYLNARLTVSEIHEDYARVLGVSAKKVSSVISELEKQGYIRETNAFYQYVEYSENGMEDKYFSGVVYVPCKPFCCVIINGERQILSERRL